MINLRAYVGMTVNPLKIRFNNHKSIIRSGAPLLKKAFIKYGINSFKFEKIDSAIDPVELGEKEKYWIKKLNTLAPNGYNMLSGGQTNVKAAEANRVPIKCVDTGEIFDSLISASNKFNIPAHLIGFVIRGRQDTANNMRFAYLDESLANKAAKKQRARLFARANWILNLDTGELFFSSEDAANALNISYSVVRHCIYGATQDAQGHRLTKLNPKRKNKNV